MRITNSITIGSFIKISVGGGGDEVVTPTPYLEVSYDDVNDIIFVSAGDVVNSIENSLNNIVWEAV